MCLNVIFCFSSMSFQPRFRTQFFPLIHVLVAQMVKCLQCRRPRFNPWVGKTPWRRKWQSSPVLLPGKSHGWRSLVGYSTWGCKESDKTERLHFHFHFHILLSHLHLYTELYTHTCSADRAIEFTEA